MLRPKYFFLNWIKRTVSKLKFRSRRKLISRLWLINFASCRVDHFSRSPFFLPRLQRRVGGFGSGCGCGRLLKMGGRELELLLQFVFTWEAWWLHTSICYKGKKICGPYTGGLVVTSRFVSRTLYFINRRHQATYDPFPKELMSPF